VSDHRSRTVVPVLTMLLLATAWAPSLYSGAFRFSDSMGVDVVTHPRGYTGMGGILPVSIGIDPTSTHADAMVQPVLNIVDTINALVPSTGNLLSDAGVPGDSYDFESVALHEVLHSLGLAHPNAGKESGLEGAERNYTRATKGTNGWFDLNAGRDGVIGSGDDQRGDDVNLHWFRQSNNNPFTMAAIVDSTTYSRDAANLPAGHAFATNGDRTIGNLLGVVSTEAVMRQGAARGEAQRSLAHDDVATLRYAMSGLDELEGNQDDYTIELTYAGRTTSADIVLDFDNRVDFAGSHVNTILPLTDTHFSIHSSAVVLFNEDWPWFFSGGVQNP